MKIQDLGDKNLVRVEFSKMKIPLVPKESGIYVLTSYFDAILYIGLSKNLQRRMIEHLNNGEKLQHTPFGKAYWFFSKTCIERDLRPSERGWILQFQLQEGKLPYFNRIEAPV